MILLKEFPWYVEFILFFGVMFVVSLFFLPSKLTQQQMMLHFATVLIQYAFLYFAIAGSYIYWLKRKNKKEQVE